MKYHESIQGERVAIAWHSLWALLCLSDVAACFFVFAQVMPLYSEGWRVAWLLWTLLGQSLFATGGALWHVVAALEHRREITQPKCRYCDRKIYFERVFGSPEWFHRTDLGKLRRDCSYGLEMKATPKFADKPYRRKSFRGGTGYA